MSERIKKMLAILDEEQMRVKIFVNENGFDCTTAPYVLVKQYRDSIKKHMEVLRCNLEE